MPCRPRYGVATIARYWVMEMAVAQTLYMIIERFKNGDPASVYRRFREQGCMAPEGLKYISSWVEQDLTTCYQVMQTADPAQLVTSAEAAEKVASERAGAREL
jgi:Protein of unknown function (DUF3303)